jgi:iron complex transport system ATP-binding protein
MLELKNLSFAYDENPCLAQVSCAFTPGQITTLIGPNGSGKSTLLKLSARLLRPQAGEVLLDEQPLSAIPLKDFARRVAVLPQHHSPSPLIAEQLVMSGRYPHQSWFRAASAEDKAAVTEAMAITDCMQFKDKTVDKLSGGERQRVFIAMILAQNTDIVLLDEPTTFLDIHVQFELMKLITQMKRDLHKTVIMVLHDLNLALNYSDHIILLNQGRIAAHGAPAEIVNSDGINQVFHMQVKCFTETGRSYYCFDQERRE